MPVFEVNEHQVQFWLRIHPRLYWGAYNTHPDPQAGAYFRGEGQER